MPLTDVHKILVVRLSSIGDIILTTPLLRSLRKAYPHAHITFLIKKQFRELLEHSPYIDELITFDKSEGMAGLKKTKKELKQQQFDLYLDIHRNLRSRFLRYGLGARHNTTYSKLIAKRTLLIWTGINLYGKVKPVYERYFDAVRRFGIQYDGQGTEIHIHPDALETAHAMLKEAGHDFVAPLVVICPSATYFNKRWLPEGFVATARHLIAEKNAFVVVHGGPGDEELCNRIAGTIGQRSVSMAGKLSLAGSAALLQHSTLVIANDTGLLHLAQSQKKPVVGIYGPTTRELGYFPIEQNSIVVETQVSCRPCTHNGLNSCPKKHFRCMKDITAGKVIAAALTFLP